MTKFVSMNVDHDTWRAEHVSTIPWFHRCRANPLNDHAHWVLVTRSRTCRRRSCPCRDRAACTMTVLSNRPIISTRWATRDGHGRGRTRARSGEADCGRLMDPMSIIARGATAISVLNPSHAAASGLAPPAARGADRRGERAGVRRRQGQPYCLASGESRSGPRAGRWLDPRR